MKTIKDYTDNEKIIDEMQRFQYHIEEININSVCSGDTVLHDDRICTVSNNDLRHSDFMGLTLFGDSYKLGTLPVLKIVFHKPTK